MGLLSGEGSNGNQHSGVNGACVVEEGAQDLLDVFGVFGVEGKKGVGGRSILSGGTVRGFLPCVWSVLWAGWCRMVEALEGTFNVPRDGDVDCAIGVVPCKCKSTILRASPIFTYSV
jgi:hypothetical protein